METRQVREIMIPLDEYPHVPYWFTLRQAVVEMQKSEIVVENQKSLPRVILVFDKDYRLLGLVRRRDIFRGLEPELLSDNPDESRKGLFDLVDDSSLCENTQEEIIGIFRERADQPVQNIMIPIKDTVNYDERIVCVIGKMVKNDMSLIPVLKDGQVIGVVRSVDVFREISQYLL